MDQNVNTFLASFWWNGLLEFQCKILFVTVMKQTGYSQESNILKYLFIPVLLLAFHDTTNYSNEGPEPLSISPFVALSDIIKCQ